MPRRIVTVSGSPTRNPDAELIALVSALNKSKGSTTGADRLAFDKQKFADELRERGVSEDALTNFAQALGDPLQRTPSEQFLREGGLATLMKELTEPTQRRLVEPPISKGDLSLDLEKAPDEDPEVTARKEAIKKTIPDPLGDVGEDFIGDQGDLLNALTPRPEVAPIEEDDVGVRVDPFTGGLAPTRKTEPVVSDQVATGIEDISRPVEQLTKEVDIPQDGVITKEQEPSFPDGVTQATALTDDPIDGPFFTGGIELPQEERNRIIGILQKTNPAELRALTENPLTKDFISTILNRKTLAQQILEKAISTGIGFNHLDVWQDELGSPFLIDKSTKKLIALKGEVGKVAKAFGDGLPNDFKVAMLANFSLDDLRSGRISSEQMMSAFIKDKSFEAGRKASLDILKSDAIKATRIIETATKNAFTATGLANRNLGDQALIVMFNKLIDPTSVVREGEFDRMGLLRNIDGNVKVFIERMRDVSGAGLIDEEREQILEFAMGVRVNTILIGTPDIIEANDIAASIAGFDKRLGTPPSIREKVAFAKATETYRVEKNTTYLEAAEEVGKALLKIKRRKRGKR